MPPARAGEMVRRLEAVTARDLWVVSKRTNRTQPHFASFGPNLNYHLSNGARAASTAPSELVRSAARYGELYAQLGLAEPVRVLHDALRALGAGRHMSAGHDVGGGNGSFGGGIYRQNFPGGSFPLHFDSIRYAQRFLTERKCMKGLRAPPRIARRARTDRFSDLYRFSTQFSALLLLQKSELPGAELSLHDAHWSDLLHDCALQMRPTVHNVHLRNYQPGLLRRWRVRTLELQPGDFYVFNSNRLHSVHPVPGDGSKSRLSLGSFAGFDAREIRVWS